MDPLQNLNKLIDEHSSANVVPVRPNYIAHEHVLAVPVLKLDQSNIPKIHKSTAAEFNHVAALSVQCGEIEEGDTVVGSLVGGMCFSNISNPIGAMTVYESACTEVMYPTAVILTTFDSEYDLLTPELKEKQDKLRDTLTNLKIPFTEIKYDDKDYSSVCDKYVIAVFSDSSNTD